MIKIFLISYSLNKGGAAIAAKKFGDLLVGNKHDVSFISQDRFRYWHFLKRLISYALVKLQRDGSRIKSSLNFFSYAPVLKAFSLHADVYNIHWINNDTLSIFDFDKIPRNTIFTLHDEWLYCGVEHYYNIINECSAEVKIPDFIRGYRKNSPGVRGVNWSFYIWSIKKDFLENRTDIVYTVPSTWMLDRARRSQILKGADVRLLPNPIDVNIFKPLLSSERCDFRKRLGFCEDDFVIIFGAIKGNKNPAKGGAEFEQALVHLRIILSPDKIKKVRLIAFGDEQKTVGEFSGFPCLRVGHINDPADLSALYSSSDCAAIPSLIESFGQVAAEALACMTPVICFATSGLKDIVFHEKNGFVATPFDTYVFAEMIRNMIELSAEERILMGTAGRDFVANNFSYHAVSHKYLKLVNEVSSRR